MTDTDPELRQQLADAIRALGKAETELDALRTVARGYCPACGRGDAAPTVEDWEQQRQRADRAETALREILAHLYAITRLDDPTPLGYQAIHPIRPDDYQRWTGVLEEAS